MPSRGQDVGEEKRGCGGQLVVDRDERRGRKRHAHQLRLSSLQAHAFLDRLPVSPADKERIAHGNAEQLLRL